MRTPPFELYTPKNLEEALARAGELADAGQDFDWIAGGTDLLPNYKWHINVKPHVISLAKVSELTELNPNHIGAMVRLHDLVKSEHTPSPRQSRRLNRQRTHPPLWNRRWQHLPRHPMLLVQPDRAVERID